MSESQLYRRAAKGFLAVNTLVGPVTLFVNAPFGRFTPKTSSVWLVDGIRAWIIMELVSPAMLLYAYLSQKQPTSLSLSDPSTFLLGLFLIHYTNRALISPLRTPSRSKSHIMVPMAAVAFNIFNGSLMGTYLASPTAARHLTGAYNNPVFWLGATLWAGGFVGNIVHDEILLNLRRKPKGNSKEDLSKEKPKPAKGEHYAIPHGYLYEWISYPNYFCEWFEWFGFALAASPIPSFSILRVALKAAAKTGPSFFPAVLPTLDAFANTIAPPWIFFLSEIATMLPRAWKGHQWYHDKFGAEYPAKRRAVIPWIL